MRVAMFGAGEMGSTHARAYAKFGKKEGVEVAAVVSRNAAKARKLAKEVVAAAFTNFEKVLADDSIEAVDVTVPSGHHRKYVVAALNGGKHVFCETPMALTLREADAMIAAAKVHRRLLLVAQVMRFVSAYQHAHEEAVSGHLGKPRSVVARRLSRPFWTAKHRRPFSEYGEPLIELSIHDFDVANWILGHPVSVMASGIAGATGAIEHAFVSIHYRGGNALVEGSAMMPPGFPFTTAVRVQGENGVLDHTDQLIRGPVPVTRSVRYSPEGIQPVRVRGQDPYEEECRHFVRCVQGRAEETALSPAAERDALQIALAAKESIRTGSKVLIQPAGRNGAPAGV